MQNYVLTTYLMCEFYGSGSSSGSFRHFSWGWMFADSPMGSSLVMVRFDTSAGDRWDCMHWISRIVDM